MTNNQVIFRCVFDGILDYLVPDLSLPLDFTGLLLYFVEIMSDKVILDHKKTHLAFFEIFHLL